MTPDFAAIARSLQHATGRPFEADGAQSIGGGSINTAWRLETSEGPVFLKTNARGVCDMFAAEAEGLQELTVAECVRVPGVISYGVNGEHAWIAMEWIDQATDRGRAEVAFGERLAHQHRVTAARFGWHRDNTIGSTPQRNGWSDDWIEFLASERLGFQLGLALAAGHGSLERDGCRLLESLPLFYEDRTPIPSLLHGDLWSGNWAADDSGEPFMYDPAVYFGDREADIAMTRLFGGFGADFYAAYEAVWPLDPGSQLRTELYNLYHVLNHLNLFGGSYLAQAEGMLHRLLAEI